MKLSFIGWLVVLVLFVGAAKIGGLIGTAMASGDETPSSTRIVSTGSSGVYRVQDPRLGTVCYVVPQAYCQGHCAYSPAISCIRL